MGGGGAVGRTHGWSGGGWWGCGGRGGVSVGLIGMGVECIVWSNGKVSWILEAAGSTPGTDNTPSAPHPPSH